MNAYEETPLEPKASRRFFRKPRRSLWQVLGPGIITGSADDDPSGIGTYSVAGAQFGYGLLWLTPLCIPLMIAVQEMCGRIGVVTGSGIAAVMKLHYPRWLLNSVLVALVCANIFNIYADLNVMAASLRMLFGAPIHVWLIVITVVTLILLIWVPYRAYVKYLKYLCLSLLAYAVVAFIPSVHNDWTEIAYHTFIPMWQAKPVFILTVVGYFGTTISPYLFFWQAGEEMEEEIERGQVDDFKDRIEPVAEQEVTTLRLDTTLGMIFSQAITFFIVISTAATLNRMGKTDIDTARDAAVALLPLGKSAYWLFALGIIGTGLLAVPTLAGSVGYAIAETEGWDYGLYKRPSKAKAFYSTIAALVLVAFGMNFIHSISPVKGLLYAAVLNGVVAPPLIVVILAICNNPKIMAERRNRWAGNLFGWLTVAVMGLSAVIMIWGLATGSV